MLNNITQKLKNTFLNKKEKEAIENEEKERKEFNEDFKLISFIHSEELYFYNVLIISIENIFKKYKDKINTLSIKLKYNKEEECMSDGACIDSHSILLNIVSDNPSYTDANKSFEHESSLIRNALKHWSNSDEFDLHSRNKMFYYHNIKLIEKKVNSLLKDEININNRYDIYKKLLNSYIHDSKIENKSKFIDIVNTFCINKCNTEIKIDINSKYDKLVSNLFLSNQSSSLIMKMNKYEDFKNSINFNQKQETLKNLLEEIIKISNSEQYLSGNEEMPSFRIKLLAHKNNIFNYNLYQSKSGKLLYKTNYFKNYIYAKAGEKKQWEINSNYVKSFANNFGNKFMNYEKIEKIIKERNTIEESVNNIELINNNNHKKRL